MDCQLLLQTFKLGNEYGRGWIEFARHNDLAEGDVCVFELIKRKHIVLNVSMFHVSQVDRVFVFDVEQPYTSTSEEITKPYKSYSQYFHFG
ncbi:b3 domain-containing transcription factor vrn1 [Quercus suber]|uniref:B3 domain-containing transcription factor vrn1 n=1 Tax=Quercus suber TaxID=58331 RepID=A0AAW0IX19_QUESU